MGQSKRRLFDQTVTEIREGFAPVSAGELQKMIDEAVASVRKGEASEAQRLPLL